jgi:hypothetical protein
MFRLSLKRKGQTPFDLAVVALVFFIGVGLLMIVNFLAVRDMIISKQTIYLSMELDDRGSELVTLLEATSTGKTHMKILGETFASGHEKFTTEGLAGIKEATDKLGTGFTLSIPGMTITGIPKSSSSCIFDDSSDLGKVFVWPMAQKTSVSDEPGWRLHPIDKACKCHTGVDISGDGIEILAATDGIAHPEPCSGSCDTGYGNLIKISHTSLGDYETRYGHLKEILVKEGQNVKQGDVIGISGNTGKSTGSHLHFELRKNGKPIDPCSFIKEPLEGCLLIDKCSLEDMERYTAKIPIPGAQPGNLKKNVELVKI